MISEQVKAEQAAQASQKRIAALDEEATGMLAEYRQATAEATGLKAYNDQLATQVKSQQDELLDDDTADQRDRNDLARSAADDAEDGRDARRSS